MNTKIVLSVIIVLLIGVAAAGYQIGGDVTGLWQPTNPQSPGITDENSGTGITSSSGSSSSSSGQGQGSSGGVSVKVSSAEAKSIAQQSIGEPGATAGTPVLKKINGKQSYIVPVLMNGKNVGFIEIDAQTGEVVGGAGGVS